jgi:hypothetical protein
VPVPRHDAPTTGSDDASSSADAFEVGPVARQFAELADSLGVTKPGMTVADVLARVVHAAQQMVAGADLVSVTLRADVSDDDTGLEHFLTPVETDPLASRLDQLQFEAAEGPCVTATDAAGLAMAYSPDLATDARWPTYGPVAASLGARAVLSTGIQPTGAPPRLAALNLYSRRQHGLDAADRDTALILAAHAGVAINHLEALSIAETRVTELYKAIDSRDVIGQAKGILMERRGYDADQAFDALRRASSQLNTKLRDIAHTLVQRRAEL